MDFRHFLGIILRALFKLSSAFVLDSVVSMAVLSGTSFSNGVSVGVISVSVVVIVVSGKVVVSLDVELTVDFVLEIVVAVVADVVFLGAKVGLGTGTTSGIFGEEGH